MEMKLTAISQYRKIINFKRIINLNIKSITKFLKNNTGEWDFRNSDMKSSVDYLYNETII